MTLKSDISEGDYGEIEEGRRGRGEREKEREGGGEGKRGNVFVHECTVFV